MLHIGNQLLESREPMVPGMIWESGCRETRHNYQGGTLQAQATILIHELAHLFEISGFKPDFGNAAAGRDNDKAVDKNCG